jgi:hypothetical protein
MEELLRRRQQRFEEAWTTRLQELEAASTRCQHHRDLQVLLVLVLLVLVLVLHGAAGTGTAGTVVKSAFVLLMSQQSVSIFYL